MKRLFKLLILCTVLAQAGSAQVSFKILPWDDPLPGLYYEVGEASQPLALSLQKISRSYPLPVGASLRIFDQTPSVPLPGEEAPKPVIATELAPGSGESLVIVSKRGDTYKAAVLPFDPKTMPFNALTLLNLTRYDVRLRVDDKLHRMKPGQRLSLPFEYVYGEKESFKTEMAAEIEGETQLIFNGFIPLMKDARVLFFLSADLQSEKERKRLPVRFTHVYEAQLADEVRASIDQIEYEASDIDLSGIDF